MLEKPILVSETFINCFSQELHELRIRLDEIDCAAYRARAIYQNLERFMGRLKDQGMSQEKIEG